MEFSLTLGKPLFYSKGDIYLLVTVMIIIINVDTQ